MEETTTGKTGVLIRTQTVDQMVVNSALTVKPSIAELAQIFLVKIAVSTFLVGCQIILTHKSKITGAVTFMTLCCI